MKQQGTAQTLDRDWSQGPCCPLHEMESAFRLEPDTEKAMKTTLEECSGLAEGHGVLW